MNTPADPPLWSPAQQSWLQAMGYTVFVDGSVEDAVPDAGIALSAAAVETPAPREAVPAREQAPRQAPVPSEPAPARRTAPASAETPSTEPTRERPAGGRRPAVRMPDRLQIALLRASGCNPAEAETQALMAGWKLDELRGNAAAKRALWPQLRALRKRSRT